MSNEEQEDTLFLVMRSYQDSYQAPTEDEPWITQFHGYKINEDLEPHGGFLVDNAKEADWLCRIRDGWHYRRISRSEVKRMLGHVPELQNPRGDEEQEVHATAGEDSAAASSLSEMDENQLRQLAQALRTQTGAPVDLRSSRVELETYVREQTMAK